MTTRVFVTTNVNSERSEMYDKVKQFIPIAAFFITLLVALFIFSKIEPIITEHIKLKILKSNYKVLSTSVPSGIGFCIFYGMLLKQNESTRSEKTVL